MHYWFVLLKLKPRGVQEEGLETVLHFAIYKVPGRVTLLPRLPWEFFRERDHLPCFPEKLQCKVGKGVTLPGTYKIPKGGLLRQAWC